MTPHSYIGWLNIILVQFLFIRIFWTEETEGQNKNKIVGYGILFPVIPLTGWIVGNFSTNYNFGLWKPLHRTLIGK